MSVFEPYLKAVMAAVITGAASIATALDDSSITSVEWMTAALAVCGSSGVVWYVTNGRGGKWAKSLFAGLTAGFASLILAMQDNAISAQELTTTLIAIMGGLGFVAVIPNLKPPSDKK